MKYSNNRRSQAEDLGISRSNLYYKPKQARKDWLTKVLIEECLKDNHSYGHKRLALHLKINKKRVLRVMKLFGIKPYRRRDTKPKRSRGKTSIEHPNLLLGTSPLYPNNIWASDFTYLWFLGSWLYVATVIDLYTRKIVGLAISRNHDRWLVTEALLSSLQNHGRPDIIHGDHGSEYCSKDYQSILIEIGIKPSMSAKGCPWENGYQESFYNQFKVELGDPARFKTIGELTAEIYKVIYYYNNKRIHTSLKMAPIAFAKRYDMLNLLVQNVS